MKEEKSDKITAVVKLGLWLIFIAVLIIVAHFGGKNNNDISNNDLNVVEQQTENKQEDNIIKQISYEEKLNKLLNDNYGFLYEIKVNDTIYIFIGEKTDNKESGYRILNGEYIYYLIENGETFEVYNDGTESHIINNIYENLDINYLNIAKIKEMIANVNYIEKDNKYTYELDDKKIVIYTNSEKVTKIETIINEDYYKIEFRKITSVNDN